MSEGTQRKLAAIVSADVVGYSRLMGADETGTLATLRAHRRELIDPLIAEYGGRIVKTMGDGLLLEFPSVVGAVKCSIKIQRGMAERNAAVPEDRRIIFRVGINLGDIVVDGEDIHGDGVNVAARLQEASEPGGLALSGVAYESLGSLVDATFEDSGRQQLKNIARPVQIWRWSPVEGVAPTAETVDVPLPLSDKPSIAVLPFDNMSGDPEQEYFSDGITEDIITALSKYREFTVIARNTTFTFKGSAVGVKQVASELGVRYVLEGSVRKSGNRVRVTTQLIDAATENHLWADRYDRELEDIFAVQDEITTSVVGAIEPRIYAVEFERSQRKAPHSLEAWECCMRALLLLERVTQEDFKAADKLLDQAIAIDPNYAQAYSFKAYLRAWMAAGGRSERIADELAEAMEHAEKALSLDADDHWAHYAAGFAHTMVRRADEAMAEMRVALSINPNFSIGHSGLGMALVFNGETEEGLSVLEAGLRINPRAPFLFAFNTFLALGNYLAGRDEDAVRFARDSLRQRPDYLPASLFLAAALGQLGRKEEARDAGAAVLRLLPNFALARHERATPICHEADRRRYIDGLRKAGLPE